MKSANLAKLFKKSLHRLQAPAERSEEGWRGAHRARLLHREDPVGAEAGPAGRHDDGLPQLPHHQLGKTSTV